jgi:hypothetical protein
MKIFEYFEKQISETLTRMCFHFGILLYFIGGCFSFANGFGRFCAAYNVLLAFKSANMLPLWLLLALSAYETGSFFVNGLEATSYVALKISGFSFLAFSEKLTTAAFRGAYTRVSLMCDDWGC